MGRGRVGVGETKAGLARGPAGQEGGTREA